MKLLGKGAEAEKDGSPHRSCAVPARSTRASGRLSVVAKVEDGRPVSVRFRNVPSFVHSRGLTVETRSAGSGVAASSRCCRASRPNSAPGC